MTYQNQVVDDIVVLETKVRMSDGNGDYLRLHQSDDLASVRLGAVDDGQCSPEKCSVHWWAKVVLFSVCLLAATAAFFVWGGPLLINKVVIPVLDWEARTFSKPVLGMLLFASIAVFPTLLLPSTPSMWLAGMTFGYGYGFLLIMAGISLGMSFPFFIGSLFRHKIHRWLEKWPKKVALITLAGEGNWFHQFRAVTLLRISPFPYIIFNYASVATNVKYCPYICGSLVGAVPEVFVTIYSGILIRSLADASHGHEFLSVEQIVYDIIGFGVAVTTTVAITVYAKKTLQTLQAEDELN